MRLPLILFLVISGCSSSHLPTTDGDAGAGSDTGSGADAWTTPDSGLDPDATSLSCGTVDPPRTISIGVEQLGFDGCAEISGEVTSIITLRGGAGVRVDVDGCPMADDDCRCSYTMLGISPAATQNLAIGDYLDVRASIANPAGRVTGQHIVFTLPPTCRCDGCDCSIPRVLLYAQDGLVDDSFWIPRFEFEIAYETCRADLEGPCDEVRNAIGMRRRPVLLPGGGEGEPPGDGGDPAPPQDPPSEYLTADEGQTNESDQDWFLGVVRSTEPSCPSAEPVVAPSRAAFFAGQWVDRFE